MIRSDYVVIEAEGQPVDRWTDYKLESNILTPADSFSMTIEVGGRGQDARNDFEFLRELLAKNVEVRAYVGDDITGRARNRYLQMSGRIDKQTVEATKEGGAQLTIEGRDLASYLVDCAVPVGVLRQQAEGATFIDLARTCVAPWAIEVISDASAARDVLTGRTALTPAERLEVEQARAQGISPRLMTRQILRRAQRARVPVDEYVGTTPSPRARRLSSSGMVPSDVERQNVHEAAPQVGETVWSFLSRHAERLGIMMWMDPRGKLILGSPHYEQEPLYRFVRRYVNDTTDPNNFASGPVERDAGEQFSKVTIHGRAHGRGSRRSRIVGVAEDTNFPFVREHVETDANVRTQEQAERAARKKLREGRLKAETVRITAPDHGLGHYLYAIDTTADVVDEYGGIDGRRYVTSRTFVRSRERGTHTDLQLVQLHSLTI